MKTVVIMRHAKSDWSDEQKSDFERRLNKRGEKNARLMGLFLRKSGAVPDVIVTSAANRAETTAGIVADSCGFKGEIEVVKELYAGTEDDYLSAIEGFNEAAASGLIVGHNPVVENLVAHLACSGSLAVRMPTAAMACLESSSESWRGRLKGSWVLSWLVTPRILEEIVP